MRIWRHIEATSGNKILIYSLDTDVYVTGIGLAQKFPHKHIIVEINAIHSQDMRYVHIEGIATALKNDPDVSSIPHTNLMAIFLLYQDVIIYHTSVDLEREHS